MTLSLTLGHFRRGSSMTHRFGMRHVQLVASDCDPTAPSLRGAVGDESERWWDRIAAAAAVSPRGAFASGTAARLHRFASFREHDPIEVVCPKGWYPNYDADVEVRHTRGLTVDDVVSVETPVGVVRVLDPATMLVVLAATSDEHTLDRALVDAFSIGLDPTRLRAVAQRWSQRGRVGPPLLLRVLDDRLGRRLPQPWFVRLARALDRRLAARGETATDVQRVACPHRVGASIGRRGVELPVAVPSARVAVVERPSAALTRQLRDRGWTLINVGWRDVHRADLVAARVAMAVAYAPRRAA